MRLPEALGVALDREVRPGDDLVDQFEVGFLTIHAVRELGHYEPPHDVLVGESELLHDLGDDHPLRI